MEGEVAGNCLRCGAPYGPDDTVCYTCGASIGETRSNTQPVKAMRPTLRPATAGGAATPPAAPAAPRLTTPPRLTVGSATAIASPVGQPAPRRRHHVPGVVVAALCLVLIAMAGGAIAVLQQLTAAPPVAHQTTYTDPRGHFAFTRPTLWKVAETPAGVTLADSTSVTTASVTTEDATPTATARAIADSRAAKQGLSAAPSRSFAGETWEVRSGQVTGADGVFREDVLLVTIRAGTVYTLEFVCPVASYEATNRLVYQPLLDSFRFA